MQTVSFQDNVHEMPNPIFWDIGNLSSNCRLLNVPIDW